MVDMKTKRTKVGKNGVELISGGMDDFEFDDDCAVCRAMKKAKERGKDLTEKELIKAFGEAEKERMKTLN